MDLLVDLLHEGTAKVTQTAAAHAAGELAKHVPGIRSAKSWPLVTQTLRTLATVPDELLHATALTALAKVGDPEVLALAARGLLHANPALRDYSIRAAALYSQRQSPPLTQAPVRMAPISDAGRLDPVRLLQSLLPPTADAETLAALLPLLETELIEAARPAIQQSEEVVQTIALALTTPPSLGWQPLTADLNAVSPATRTRALDTAKRIATALTPEFIVQSTHPNSAVRMAAVRVLATQDSDEARAAVQTVLSQGDEETCRAVLAALGDFPNSSLMPAVAALLHENRPWPLRQLAASTLQELGAENPTAIPESVGLALLASAEHDSNAFVREQALRAWNAWDRVQAKPALTRAAKSDPEERVRRIAEALLEGRE
jgi:HEAT repeat protein